MKQVSLANHACAILDDGRSLGSRDGRTGNGLESHEVLTSATQQVRCTQPVDLGTGRTARRELWWLPRMRGS